jgi:acetyltransferase-like isoleucine patch superfamily enzyme
MSSGAAFPDAVENGRMPAAPEPTGIPTLRCRRKRRERNSSSRRAQDQTMARRLVQLLPRSLRSFVKDRYLARKYPMLTFGKEVNIKEATFGRHTQIADRVNIFHCNIGDYSYIEVGTVAAYANIGKFCSIAGGTYIGLGVHPSRQFVSTHPAFYSTGRGLAANFAQRDYLPEYAPVNIGNDVWIGTAAIIKGGITVGDGAIIGAGAVVTKDIPAYAIVGGSPAKLIRYRFDPQTIEFLMNFKWWDKSDQWLKDNFRKFHDVADFVHSLSTYGE